jgi:acetate kinase
MSESAGPVLAVNVGSSSLKLSVLDADDKVLAKQSEEFGGERRELEAGFERILAEVPALAAAGHRVVHGGDRFSEPVLVDNEAEADLEGLADLAPLHNPPAVAAIEVLRQMLPELPSVACFDTAFHATIPPAASTYAVPSAWSAPMPLRRYGFHGLSHAYAGRRAAELLEREPAELRIVTAHLGAGASLCAVKGGVSVDTTMGFTPLEGLVMATRSGSVDPGLLLWVQRHGNLSADEMEQALDRESGLAALSGTTGDMREVLAGVDEGDKGCQLAFDVYINRLAAAVAAMTAAMNGLDALVFTGGIGENSPRVRAAACAASSYLGLAIDEEGEPAGDGDRIIPSSRSGVDSLVVGAREDIELASLTRSCLSR